MSGQIVLKISVTKLTRAYPINILHLCEPIQSILLLSSCRLILINQGTNLRMFNPLG